MPQKNKLWPISRRQSTRAGAIRNSSHTRRILGLNPPPYVCPSPLFAFGSLHLVLRRSLAKQIRGHFSVPWAAYIFRVPTPRKLSACTARRKRRREAAVGRFAFWTLRWSAGWLHGRVVGKGGYVSRGWVMWVDRGDRWWSSGMGTLDVARSAPGVRRQFFFLEFSKGNDLRYISKGFLLVGKRMRRRYPPTGGPAVRSRGYRTICISQPLI